VKCTLTWIIAIIMAAFLIAVASFSALANPSAHHEIQLRIDPAGGSIRINDRISVLGQHEINFSLAGWMRIAELRVDGKQVEHSLRGELYVVDLPDRGRHVVEVLASGSLPKPEADKRGHQTGAGPVAEEDGVYLPGWSGWFPSVQGIKSTYRLSITTPQSHRSTATAELVAERNGQDDNFAEFESYPDPEPPSVFAGPYSIAEKQSGSVRIRTYFHDPDTALAQQYLSAAEKYIRTFEGQIGDYPFSNFTMVSAPLPVGLGFPGLTYIDRRILRLPFMRGRSLAHEVLHNWWGNGVIPDYRSGNWSEGLTTYMADHASAATISERRASEMRLGWLRDFAALPAEKDRPVNQFIAKKHDAAQVIGYGKVAYIFHMLKHEVGATAFDAAIKHLWDRQIFKTTGWSHIKSAFEAVSDRNLDWFFRQWIDNAGAPQLTLGDVKSSGSEGAYSLEFSLSQSSPAYRLKIPVQIETEHGKQNFDIEINSTTQTIKRAFASKPLALHVDPEHTLFRRLLPGEAPPIFRDVLLDQSAKTLILHDQPPYRKSAQALATRLFGRKPIFKQDPISNKLSTPALVVGTTAQVSRYLASLSAGSRPEEIESRGTSRAWTGRVTNGSTILFVEAETSDDLKVMIRALPHYRSKSFVTFEGRRSADHGVWRASNDPLSKRL
jgi:aminopeptidase N